MENKPLVIDVLPSAMPPTGENNRWSEMSNMAIFIRDIKTQSLHKDADMGAVVSGIPTPYARIDLFKNAIDRTGTVVNASSGDGLNAYYAELVKEWRGFLACIALDYPKISVKHVNLSYHDGKDISETSNIYEPLGAFGNMLLDRRALWCEQG
ncbi:MAG: hypothetical protein K2M76_01105, partial [Muribaculaceae bacterium]|nr:hypothetical protein [Muribaculaceae bacterium]